MLSAELLVMQSSSFTSVNWLLKGKSGRNDTCISECSASCLYSTFWSRSRNLVKPTSCIALNRPSRWGYICGRSCSDLLSPWILSWWTELKSSVWAECLAWSHLEVFSFHVKSKSPSADSYCLWTGRADFKLLWLKSAGSLTAQPVITYNNGAASPDVSKACVLWNRKRSISRP